MSLEIVAPNGAFLSVAIIGVESLNSSLRFYRDLIGLTASDTIDWKGPEFERFWHLPMGSSGKAAFLHSGPDPVGRILLVQFNDLNRRVIRADKPARAYGLFNLNFYTSDIQGETHRFRELGYEFWSEPKTHAFTPGVGTPIEVVFEGPDGVVINWVELATTDKKTRIGQMRAYLEAFGQTPKGFTPVVTTASCMRNIDKATSFYKNILNMGVIIDEVLDSDAYREFQRVPSGGRTKIRFMQGNHMFGKIAMSQPLNYPVSDLVPHAIAPNIGYLMQTFLVPDLQNTHHKCLRENVEVYSPRLRIDFPGLGLVETMVVRNPGSGALQQLVQL